jgi:hypothetical protein
MSKLAEILRARASAWAAQRKSEELDHEDADGDSGIREAPSGSARWAAVGAEFEREVTLIVYAWQGVQPGAMSWVFPSAQHALRAAKAMRNAVSWAIVRGRRPAAGLDQARASGNVLLEHTP